MGVVGKIRRVRAAYSAGLLTDNQLSKWCNRLAADSISGVHPETIRELIVRTERIRTNK